MTDNGQRLARWIFGLAAVYGFVTLLPSYGGLSEVAPDASADAVLFFHSFLSLAIAFQVLFAIIASDPRRHRLAMIPAMLDKIAFGIPVLLMRDISAAADFFVPFALADLAFLPLFAIAFFACSGSRDGSSPVERPS